MKENGESSQPSDNIENKSRREFLKKLGEAAAFGGAAVIGGAAGGALYEKAHTESKNKTEQTGQKISKKPEEKEEIEELTAEKVIKFMDDHFAFADLKKENIVFGDLGNKKDTAFLFNKVVNRGDKRDFTEGYMVGVILNNNGNPGYILMEKLTDLEMDAGLTQPQDDGSKFPMSFMNTPKLIIDSKKIIISYEDDSANILPKKLVLNSDRTRMWLEL